MASYKIRRYTIPQADAATGITLSPATLGFNPSHAFRKAQISTNDFGGGSGEFEISFAPIGSDDFYPFQLTATPVGGTDVVIVGRDEDPIFESLKVVFAGATSDIELTIGFVDPDGQA